MKEASATLGVNYKGNETESDETCVMRLCRDAVEQNRLAKEKTGWARQVAYQRKNELLSLLLLMDHVEINSVEFPGGCPIIGLTLPAIGHRLHAGVNQLTPDARDVAFRRIERFWESAS